MNKLMKCWLVSRYFDPVTVFAVLGMLSILLILSWILGTSILYDKSPDTVTSWDGFRVAVMEVKIGVPYIFGGLVIISTMVFGGLFLAQPLLLALAESRTPGSKI